MLSSQEDEPQDPTLYCMLVRNICSEFNLYSGLLLYYQGASGWPRLYLTRSGTEQPTLHLVCLSSLGKATYIQHTLISCEVSPVWLDFSLSPSEPQLLTPQSPLPPTSFNSLTTPWHLRVPGIRLKWDRGHKLWFPAQIPHKPIKCMQVWSEPKEFLSTKR